MTHTYITHTQHTNTLQLHHHTYSLEHHHTLTHLANTSDHHLTVYHTSHHHTHMSNLIYSSRFMSTNAYLPTSITLLDDGLKRDRFVYIGWSGLILLPTSYLAIGAWLTSTSFVTSFYTHALSTSYLEGCNLLTASVSTPSNTMGHAYLLIWSEEASLSLTPWVCIGGTWTYITFHGLISHHSH